MSEQSGETLAVEGRWFQNYEIGGWNHNDCYDGSYYWFRASKFKTPLQITWYYLWKESFFIPVNDEQPGVIEYVKVDFNNANVGGKKWSDFESDITIDIDGGFNIVPSQSGIFNNGVVDRNVELRDGENYTMQLYLKSQSPNNNFLIWPDAATSISVKGVKGETERLISACLDDKKDYEMYQGGGQYLCIWVKFKCESSSSNPDSNPDSNPGSKPSPDHGKEFDASRVDSSYMAYFLKQSNAENGKKGTAAKVVADRDTFKSEAPEKTVIVADNIGAASFFDMKVHQADEKTNINQKFLVQNLVSPNANIFLTKNIYPRRDLSMNEDGMARTITWNNLPKNQAGPVFAVVYNQKDGAYEINGVLDANGTAVFNGFKLRSASTITICK